MFLVAGYDTMKHFQLFCCVVVYDQKESTHCKYVNFVMPTHRPTFQGSCGDISWRGC